MKPKYSIIIPTYNKCEQFLKPCIESIVKYTDMDLVEIIIVANGCEDNTWAYTNYLFHTHPNIVNIWWDDPLGYARAINKGLEHANTDKIILLNNDTILLEQNKNDWLKRLDVGDISSVLTLYSEITESKFAVFFCTMIERKVFDSIGKLDEEFLIGGSEDTDFCKRAENAGFKINDVGSNNDFPIYHVGEGTVNDENLVPKWESIFDSNLLRLSKKYNLNWYRWKLSNNYERAVFLNGDVVFPREKQRYEWARDNLYGANFLEIGCSTGYGFQFLKSKAALYTGIDYDPLIIEVAKEQEWGKYAQFLCADINTFDFPFYYDTIIAFEVIEHLDNGLEILEKLKTHCKRLLITVPHNEPKGFWGEHHKLHGLTEKDFPGFQFSYINHAGKISNNMEPVSVLNPSNLMICRWGNE